MPVTAVISITQFETKDSLGSAQDSIISPVSETIVREETFSQSSSSVQTHPPAVSQPAASSITGGQPTPVPELEHWSDSHLNDSTKLNRHRFGSGRWNVESFDQPGLPAQAGNAALWGKLDDNSGILTYQRNYEAEVETNVLETKHHSEGSVQDRITYSYGEFSVKELGEISADVTLQIFPFLLDMLPLPNSDKNSITTDIFIRLGNFSNVFDPDTIVLYVDGAVQPTLVIEEFFGGLGGFDVTWENSFSFDYDAQVDVRWEMSDLTVPTNDYVIQYPFYTVTDASGPRVLNRVPSDESSNIPIANTVYFELEDYENDVDIDSLILYVNNVKVESGVTGDLIYERFQNEKGYTVTYTHYEPWLHGDLIPVAIFIQDTAKFVNTTFHTYNFTTVQSTPPELINLKPLSCSLAIPTGTHISVDVIDGGHGLDKSTIVFTVEDIERSGQIALIPIIHRDE